MAVRCKLHFLPNKLALRPGAHSPDPPAALALLLLLLLLSLPWQRTSFDRRNLDIGSEFSSALGVASFTAAAAAAVQAAATTARRLRRTAASPPVALVPHSTQDAATTTIKQRAAFVDAIQFVPCE
ncbi:hypothetical protein ACLKA7_014902 [Drosophila subpalustris]